MKTYLCINAWYGRGETEVAIVRETSKRYLIRGLSDGTLIPGGRRLSIGSEVYVPKYAIKFVPEAKDIAAAAAVHARTCVTCGGDGDCPDCDPNDYIARH